MRVEVCAYRCDSVGCRSRYTLEPGNPEPEQTLARGGWVVITAPGDEPDQAKTRHYCPGCAERILADTPHVG